MADERLRNDGGDRDERVDTRTDTLNAPRLTKTGKVDGRYKRNNDRYAETREMAGRAMSDKRDELSDDDRLALLASNALDSILPTPPDIPGHHLFWATTTAPSDPISRRLALGYKFVNQEDVPGFEHLAVKDGEQVGRITCNEMVLMKIRIDLFQKYMTHLHHDKPQAEADKLADQVVPLKDGRGRPIGMVEGEGLQRAPARQPDFSHLT